VTKQYERFVNNMIEEKNITKGRFQSPPFDIFSLFVAGSGYKVFSYDRIDKGGELYDVPAFMVHGHMDGGYYQTFTVISPLPNEIFWMYVIVGPNSKRKDEEFDSKIDEFAFKRFFEWLEIHAKAMNDRDEKVMTEQIYRCADLHMQHISSGDPFELGSARPLDFGHWAAHKLEYLSNFQIRHGEAVAIVGGRVKHRVEVGEDRQVELDLVTALHVEALEVRDLVVTEIRPKHESVVTLAAFEDIVTGSAV
jgi:hypothetical protein